MSELIYILAFVILIIVLIVLVFNKKISWQYSGALGFMFTALVYYGPSVIKYEPIDPFGAGWVPEEPIIPGIYAAAVIITHFLALCFAISLGYRFIIKLNSLTRNASEQADINGEHRSDA